MARADERFVTNGTSGTEASKPTRRRIDWTWSEVQALRQHPDMTSRELHELVPRHSVQAIRKQRSRMGRWSPDVVPLCQRCGEHPVWTEAADARRWGLCRACALDEREYRLRHGGELSRKDNALRQAKWKQGHRGERGERGDA